MTPGAKLVYQAADWLSLSGQDRAMAIAVAMLFHEGGAPGAHLTVEDAVMRFDVRHLFHRPSGTKGRILDNIMRRLFVLFPARNGVDVFDFDPKGPHLVVKRDAVDWSHALEDWKQAGAIGTYRIAAEVKV